MLSAQLANMIARQPADLASGVHIGLDLSCGWSRRWSQVNQTGSADMCPSAYLRRGAPAKQPPPPGASAAARQAPPAAAAARRRTALGQHRHHAVVGDQPSRLPVVTRSARHIPHRSACHTAASSPPSRWRQGRRIPNTLPRTATTRIFRDPSLDDTPRSRKVTISSSARRRRRGSVDDAHVGPGSRLLPCRGSARCLRRKPHLRRKTANSPG
jgi:hypothetical protein